MQPMIVAGDAFEKKLRGVVDFIANASHELSESLGRPVHLLVTVTDLTQEEIDLFSSTFGSPIRASAGEAIYWAVTGQSGGRFCVESDMEVGDVA